jgi:hypothetical protein
MEILQFPLKSCLSGGSLPTDSFLHRLTYRTDLAATVVFLITPRHDPRRQHQSCMPPECVYRAVAWQRPPIIKNILPSNGRRFVVYFATVA